MTIFIGEDYKFKMCELSVTGDCGILKAFELGLLQRDAWLSSLLMCQASHFYG
jgi:hypothetical protein